MQILKRKRFHLRIYLYSNMIFSVKLTTVRAAPSIFLVYQPAAFFFPMIWR